VKIGHRSLVYLMAPTKRLWAAVEYVRWCPGIADVLVEGREEANAQGAVTLMEAVNRKFAKVWRCIRCLAVIDDPMKGPLADFCFQEGDIMFDMDQRDYLGLFNAVPWSWPA
jgi:hypothetical protein